jgi:hypothetical protein
MAAWGVRRRDVLKGLAALLPLSVGFGVRPVLAGPAPKRIVFFFIPDGVIPPLFHPTGSEFSFELSPMTKALEPVKEDLVFVSGLNMYDGPFGHDGVFKVMTANNTLSMDTFLADKIGSSSQLSSLYLGIHSTLENGNSYFSQLQGNKTRTPEDNPLVAFTSAFGAPGGGPSSKASVLDLATEDLATLRGKLGDTERAKLELHVEALREVEQRLTMNTAQVGACPTGGFNAEGFKVPADYNGYPSFVNREENFEVVGKLQMDLAVLALACDVTRVVGIQWSHPVSPSRMEFTGSTQRHHDASHYGNPDSDTARNFVLLQNYYSGRLRYLVDELRKRPDGDGTLLDNTLVVFFSEMGDSNIHNHDNMPFILAGRAGGALSTGRLLNYPQEAHSKLLVDIANLMDVKVDTFGYTGKGPGGLPGLRT